ncbi:MAG: class I SAM-dependent methyltransferase [Kiritimatiellae bacterium]|nr:class I SAM-dependent methyltransferase [Kiritimatiellia bacterium]
MKPRELAYCGIFGAAALLLPVLFHALQLGRIFMPMYLPLVTLAFFVKPGPAALTALVLPVLSGAVTGMPPFYPPVAPAMSLELALMAAMIGALRKTLPRLPVWAVLAVALFAGRVFSAGFFYAAAAFMSLPAGFVASISLLSGWPGIVLMLIVIPAIMRLRSQPAPVATVDPRIPFFNKIASAWDGWHDLPQVRQRLLGSLDRFSVRAGETVLDLGCGTGNLALALLERLGPEGRVLAADISPAMLEIAAAKTSDKRISWLLACAEKLPLAAHSCDRIICFSAWPHFRDPATVLAGFRRILRPDGHVHILHFISRHEVNRIHASASDHSVHSDLLPPVKEVAALFSSAGFAVTETADTDNLYLLTARLQDADTAV